MSYVYKESREHLFNDEGQRLFLKVRDHVHGLLEKAGAVRIKEVLMKHTGDSWTILACFDRMVELGEIREITQDSVCGQHRIFVAA